MLLLLARPTKRCCKTKAHYLCHGQRMNIIVYSILMYIILIQIQILNIELVYIKCIYIYVYCMVYVYGILLTFCITLCHVDPQHLRAARNVKIWAEVLSAGSQAAVWTPRSQPCPQIRSTTVD